MGLTRAIPIGATSINVTIPLRDSSTGQLKTGIAYGSVTYSYWIDGASSGGTGTCVTASKGTYADHGWVETDYAGLYQFGIPDTVLASAASGAKIKLTATGVIDVVLDIQLISATRGLAGTALPDASASASGGLPTIGTGSGQINPSSGKMPATLAAADVNGNLPSDLQTIKTQTVTCTAGVTIASYVGNATHAIAVDASGYVTLVADQAVNVTKVAGLAVEYDTTTDNKAVLHVTAVGSRTAANLPAGSFVVGATGGLSIVGSAMTLAANQHVIVDSGTVTTLTNLPAAPSNWLDAAAVKDDAVTKIQAGLSTYAGADTAGTTTLVGLLTSARAGYLDKLNITGNVASQNDIQAINQSAAKHLLITTVGQYERPETGSTVYTVEARTFSAATGAAVNADTAPTLTAAGQTSGDLSSNLSAAANPATGVYRWTYTVANTAVVEPVRFDVSATIASSTYTLSAYTQVVDVVSATWTAADAANLTAIYNKLPAYTPSVDSSGKIAATFDWSSDVTTKPTIGTSTLTTGDIDARLTAWGKTDFALASSTGWGGSALPTSFAANNLPAKYSYGFDWADVANKPTIGTSTVTTGDIDARLAAWGKTGFSLASSTGWGGSALPSIGTSTLTTTDIDGRLAAWGKTGFALASSTGWGGSALPTAFAANNLPAKYSNDFDWNDVANKPTIGTSTLSTTDIDGRLAAWGKTGFALAPSTGWGGSSLPTSFAASNLPTDYQQRAVAVTLPATPPDGYGASLSEEQVAAISASLFAMAVDDGVSFAKVLQLLLASTMNKTVRSGETIQFLARDGQTVLATLRFNPSNPGEITASTIV